MEICRNCGQSIQENQDKTPAEILGDIIAESVEKIDDQPLCPACKEELGILSLLGFGE